MSFTSSKPLASLSSGLLARKGHARPAMRPQGFGGFGAPPGAHDDLGWNDMGHEEFIPALPPVPQVVRQFEALQEEFEASEPIVEFEPEPVAETAPEPVFEAAPEPVAEIAPQPVVEMTPEPVAAPVAAPVALKPVSVATATRIDRETLARHQDHKAAFTLRLDHDRHLRLRLASALRHRSAQALVTDALDAFLQSLPEVEDLVRQLPPPKAGR